MTSISFIIKVAATLFLFASLVGVLGWAVRDIDRSDIDTITAPEGKVLTCDEPLYLDGEVANEPYCKQVFEVPVSVLEKEDVPSWPPHEGYHENGGDHDQDTRR